MYKPMACRFVFVCCLVLTLSVFGGAVPSAAELVERAKNGPSLLIKADELPAVRTRLATDADARSWWQEFRAQLDSSLAQPVAIPKRGGQWPHWMTCKACGSHIRSTSPTSHVCEGCGKTYSGWPYDDCYITTIHNRLRDAAQDCAIAWLITGERRYLERIKSILLGYAEVYESYAWHWQEGEVAPRERGAKAFSQVLEEAVWLIPLLDAYDAIRAELSDAEREKILSGLIRPAADVCSYRSAHWSNHEAWHLAAYGKAGLVLGDVKLVETAINGEYGALQQLQHCVLADGCWFEGSFGYHFYTMEALTPFFHSLRNLGYEVPKRYREMFLAPFRQLAPDGRLPAVNDCEEIVMKPGSYADQYEFAHRWYDDPIFEWWVSQTPRRSRESALWGRKSESSVPAEPTRPGSEVNRASGLAILRTQTPGRAVSGLMPDNCLFLDFGPHGGWHGHPDKLNVFFWLHGVLASEDPGCTAYGNALHWGWYKSALAHNMLRVDALNQQHAEAQVLAFATNANAAAVLSFASGSKVEGLEGPAYPGVDVVRATALKDDVVLDWLEAESETEHDYECCFHARGEFAAPGFAFEPLTGFPPRHVMVGYTGSKEVPGQDAWAWVDEPKTAPHNGQWQAAWTMPGLKLQIWQQSLPGNLETGKGCAQPTTNRLTLAVNKVRAKSTRFLSVLTAGSAKSVEITPLSESSDGTRGFTALIDGKPYTLRFRFNRSQPDNSQVTVE